MPEPPILLLMSARALSCLIRRQTQAHCAQGGPIMLRHLLVHKEKAMWEKIGLPEGRSWANGLGFVLVMVLLASVTAGAVPIVVQDAPTACVTPSLQFTTIQAAVDAAPAGATILVCPGWYQEQVFIYKPLTLKGVGGGNGSLPIILLPAGFVPNSTIAQEPMVAQVVVQSQDVTLSDLVVDARGGNNSTDCSTPWLAGIVYQYGASGAVKRVSLRNQFLHDSASNTDCQKGIGIYASGGGLVSVQDSNVRNVDLLGVLNDGSRVNVMANVITINRSTGYGVQFYYGSGAISGNFISDGQIGIGVWGPNVTITGNVISKFKTNGIICDDCSGVTASANQVYGDGDWGIYFAFCSGKNRVQFNQITGTSQGGIVVVDCAASDTIAFNILQDVPYGVSAEPGDILTQNKFYNVNLNVRYF